MMNPLQNGDLQLFKETNFSLDAFQKQLLLKQAPNLSFFNLVSPSHTSILTKFFRIYCIENCLLNLCKFISYTSLTLNSVNINSISEKTQTYTAFP